MEDQFEIEVGTELEPPEPEVVFMPVFIQVDEENRVTGWGTSSIGEGSVELLLPNDHPFFKAPLSYRYVDDVLVIDNDHELALARESRFSDLSLICENEIKGYFNAVIHGKEYSFSYDYEAQINFTGTMVLFNENAITEVEWTAHREGIAERILLNKEDFITLSGLAFTHKNSRISKLRNSIQVQLENANSLEEIEAVAW